MKLQVSQYVVGAPNSVPSQIGGSETVLAVRGVLDAIEATEALFAEGGPDTVYKASLQAISTLKKIVTKAQDDLAEAELRLKILEQKVMAL